MGTPEAHRRFASCADEGAKNALNTLLESTREPSAYRASMTDIGRQLGRIVDGSIPIGSKCLVVATAEDADYLAAGVIESLRSSRDILAAIFWNNHYPLNNGSIAPVVHRYLQPGYQDADYLVVVKSIISSSCVVRTNILALIEQISPKRIFVVSPVMYIGAENALRDEFPPAIADLFEFVYFAVDDCRTETGEVRPGIGGQVYQLLGLEDQPARTGFMPQLVKTLMAL